MDEMSLRVPTGDEAIFSELADCFVILPKAGLLAMTVSRARLQPCTDIRCRESNSRTTEKKSKPEGLSCEKG